MCVILSYDGVTMIVFLSSRFLPSFTDMDFFYLADALVSTGLADLGYVYVNIGTILTSSQ